MLSAPSGRSSFSPVTGSIALPSAASPSARRARGRRSSRTPSVAQRLQQRDGVGRRERAELRDRRDLLVGVVARERLDERPASSAASAAEVTDTRPVRRSSERRRTRISDQHHHRPAACPRARRTERRHTERRGVPARRGGRRLPRQAVMQNDRPTNPTSPRSALGSSFFFSLPAMYGLHGCALIGPWSSTRP